VTLRPRPAVLVSALVLLSAACQQDDRPTAAATSTTVAATTTTKPSPTAEELAWVEGLTALRKRLEERTRLQSGVRLTQLKLGELIAAGRSCTPSLAELGTPSSRLQGAHRTAQAGCRYFNRSAQSWLDARKLMAVADHDVDQVQQHLIAAKEHEGNGINWLVMANSQVSG
jgi:hypothetical protein